MKPKDMIALIFAVVFLAAVGFFFYKSQAPKASSASESNASMAEVVPTIDPNLDSAGTLTALSTTYHVQDFTVPYDLNGLGNTSLFGN